MIINNNITHLLGIRLPIIQAGMVWVSGWKLASAVSNNGGLGLIGAGSMKPELLREHIQKCKSATNYPFGINIPLLRKDVQELIDVVTQENMKIVFTSAGHPGKYIDQFKKHDIVVIQVVPSLKFALKAESVGCDAIVGEGVEAGGHNGTDEITTLCLIPQLVDSLKIPVIAAGGISDGRTIAAAFALGAQAVQIGTLFAATEESSAHINYKQSIINAGDNGSTLLLKKIGLVRALKNKFTDSVSQAELKGADEAELKILLGEKRERLGIFEGDLENGLLEAGQGSGLIKKVISVEELFNKLTSEFDSSIELIRKLG